MKFERFSFEHNWMALEGGTCWCVTPAQPMLLPRQLLPLQPSDDKSLKHHWDYIYEPDANVVIDDLLLRYVEALVYQAVAESMASEQSARMVAMKSATDNAEELIKNLSRTMNRARQDSITTEIMEIVGGAEALSSGEDAIVISSVFGMENPFVSSDRV